MSLQISKAEHLSYTPSFRRKVSESTQFVLRCTQTMVELLGASYSYQEFAYKLALYLSPRRILLQQS